ncbi:hypothetical protein H4R34_005076 [Dimargaris verticillata]|uniref:Glycosyl transferase family 25 domain-containing protein n=1 Tax=Dimargaris verticillata TaxID=2761393 RepID=A0A9W8AZH0_9FUNG|nr:hypothetical protein H4R34_005076 [Dimargaris verticillata]
MESLQSPSPLDSATQPLVGPKSDPEASSHRLRRMLKFILYGLIAIAVALQVIGAAVWRHQRQVTPHQASPKEIIPLLSANETDVHQTITVNSTVIDLDFAESLVPEREEVDHVYVVNLETRTDRRDLMSILMQYAGLDVEFFPGTTPGTLGFVPGAKQRPKSLTKGQLACWRSHMNVYRDVMIQGYRHALILEDDVDLEIDTKDLLAEMIPRLPNDWDLFYAGFCGSVNKNDRVDELDPPLLRFYNTGCTHGYVVSLRGAARLLYLLQKPTGPIDLMILTLAHHNVTQVFATNPPWIAQVRRPDDPTNIPGSWGGRLWEGLRNSTRAMALADLVFA